MLSRLGQVLCWAASFGTQSASAACLLDDYSIPTEYSRSELVLVGKVVSERVIPEGSDLGGINYRIVPLHILKGPPSRNIVLFSENSSGRFPMTVGASYVLFVYHAEGRLAVDNCGNSAPQAQAAATLATIEKLARKPHEIKSGH